MSSCFHRGQPPIYKVITQTEFCGSTGRFLGFPLKAIATTRFHFWTTPRFKSSLDPKRGTSGIKCSLRESNVRAPRPVRTTWSLRPGLCRHLPPGLAHKPPPGPEGNRVRSENPSSGRCHRRGCRLCFGLYSARVECNVYVLSSLDGCERVLDGHGFQRKGKGLTHFSMSFTVRQLYLCALTVARVCHDQDTFCSLLRMVMDLL